MCSPHDIDEIEERIERLPCSEPLDLFEALAAALGPGSRVWCEECAHSIPEAELVRATTYRPENKVCPACYSEGWHLIGDDDAS